MSVNLLASQPGPPPTPQSPSPAVALLRAGLEALSARLGQTLPATVIGTDAQGLTQLRIGELTVAVKLSQPLPAGAQIEVAVQPAPNGAVTLTVQPRAPLPAPPPLALPQAAGPPAMPPAPAPLPAPQPQALASQPAPAAPAPAPAPAAIPASAAAPAPAVSPSPAAVMPVPVMQAPPAPPVPAMTATVPQAPLQAMAPPPTPVSISVAAPAIPATNPGIPMTAAAPPASLPAPAALPMATSAPLSVRMPIPTMPSAPPTDPAAPRMPGASPTAQPVARVPVSAPPVAPPTPTAGSAPSARPHASAVPGAPPPSTAPNPPISAPAAAAPQAAIATSVRTPTISGTSTPAAPASQPVSQPAPPRAPGAATVRPGVPTLPLTQPAQAAARQDSMAPLLRNLAVVAAQLDQLPKPVAEAAARLIAARVPVDRGVTAAALRQAVQRSGVFLEPPAKAGAQPADVKSALLQLRTGLLSLLEGGAIAPIAAIGRRPAPPMRDAQPRGMAGEGPTLRADAKPQDAARTLLHQTDAALSRLKLVQLASQPMDAAVRAAAAAPDFVVELPMTLGAELAMMQLQVQRDGRQKAKAAERGWRVRFAVSFSAIGEVGAQVSLLGKTTNVVVWADEPATADALEEMLPDLAPALAARGLTVGSIRLRRGVPEADRPAPSGRLMDTLT